MDSETAFSSDSDYDEFANEILSEGNILQLCQFKPIFTAAEILAKKDLVGTSAIVFDRLLHHRTWCASTSLGTNRGQKLKDGWRY